MRCLRFSGGRFLKMIAPEILMYKSEPRFYPVTLLTKPAFNFEGAWPKEAPCACGCGVVFMKKAWSEKTPACRARGKAASEAKSKKKKRAQAK